MVVKLPCPTCKKVPTIINGMTLVEMLVAYLETPGWGIEDIPNIPGTKFMSASEIEEALAIANTVNEINAE